MKIEWLNAELTRARITIEANNSRWWRRRYVTAEIEQLTRRDWPSGYTDWRFVVGGDRICDHDDALAQRIHRMKTTEQWQREAQAKRAKLRNPWSDVVELPPARSVKQ